MTGASSGIGLATARMKGPTDALRMELVAEGAPVSVTLVRPATAVMR